MVTPSTTEEIEEDIQYYQYWIKEYQKLIEETVRELERRGESPCQS
jgi:hypothetical protein